MSPSSPSPAAAPIFSPVAPVTPTTISPSTAVPPPRPFSPLAPTPPSNPSPPPPPPGKSPPVSSPPNHPTSRSVSTPAVTGIAVGSVALVVLLCLLWICCKKKKRRPLAAFDYYGGHPPPPQPMKDDAYVHSAQKWPPPHHQTPFALHPPNPISKFPPPPPRPVIGSSGGSGSISSRTDPLVGFSRSTFMFEELARATDQFSDTNLLGQGGFGYVHRGVLPNGKEVAVKQLKTGSSQGEREFQAEVEIIGRVHHKHLVSLIGYCISDEQRLLVYEYVPNKTLEFHLHGKDQAAMCWPTRLKIAMGSAKGLAYLHEDCHPNIIHRDIKAANILLDLSFEAKVADFGLAKFSSDNNTHVSTRVMGTFGYLAPEYASTGKLTDKSDVFSFGVMLLELITGKRPVDRTYSLTDESLFDWARPLMKRALVDGDYTNLIDPKLGNNYNRDEMARMIACAAACVRHSAKRRPSMALIVRALQGGVSLEYANEGGVKPENSSRTSYSSSENESIQYNQYMRKFEKTAASRDSSSSKYSAPMSDYSLNTSSSSEGEQAVRVEMSKMNN